jgi:non-specific serine/threonine protein kinase
VRLLTLTGTGGVGKTRLALQAVATATADTEPNRASFPDGAWFVDLAPVTDEALVSMTIAQVLGIRKAPGRPVAGTLLDYMRNKRLLLVLDNCEHLIQACAGLAQQLLRICPDLHILTTSREVLGMTGEVAWRVPSLGVPERSRVDSLADVAGAEAVRLFVSRAQAVLPTFELNERNARSVAEVCGQLDGIPLALELAAARVRVLTVEEIAARLDDRFGLLTGGNRAALPRQRTLRATLDWSHDLLSESERVLFRRLAVFAGGWTLEAADSVCSWEGMKRESVLDLLSGLVDKSLVVAEARDAEGRYRLLETIRQYAKERLLDADESDVLGTRHCDWFLHLAEIAAPQLKARDQQVWLRRLSCEHDNLRAALVWAGTRDAAEVALRLAAALSWFWFLRSDLAEGRRWVDAALARGDAPGIPKAHVQALYGAGILAWQDGDHPAARAWFEEQQIAAQALGDKRGLAYAIGGLAMIADVERDVDALGARISQGLALSEEVGDAWGVAWNLIGAGLAQLELGDIATARARFEQSVTTFETLGDQWASAVPLSYLGVLAASQDDERARSLFEQALAIWRGVGDRSRIAEVLNHLGGVALRQANHEQAIAHFLESLEVARDLGNRQYIACALGGLAAVLEVEERLQEAAQLLGTADELLDAVGLVTVPEDLVEYRRTTSALRARLAEPTLSAAWGTGRSLELNQAIALFLARDTPFPAP